MPELDATIIAASGGATAADLAGVRENVTPVIRPVLIAAETMNDVSGGASPTAQAARVANTQQMLLAVARAKSYTALTGLGSNRCLRAPKIIIDPGVFAFDSSARFVIDFPGFTLGGAGKYASMLLYNGSNALFDIGAFSTTPSDVFGGIAGNYELTDIAIFNPLYLDPSNHGNRIGQAIRDSGCGSGVLRGLRIGGFAYGLNFAYGSDFTRTDDCYIELCDVGTYHGPGGQQQLHTNTVTYLCRESHVIDRPGQVVFDMPVDVGPKVASFVFEAPTHGATTGSTRQLSSFPVSGTFGAGQIKLRDAWFESNPGNLGASTIPSDGFVFFNNIGAGFTYFQIEIENPIVFAGQTSTVWARALVNCSVAGSGCQYLVVNRPVLHGKMDMWFRGPGNRWILKDRYVADGYSDIIVSTSTNTRSETSIENYGRSTTSYSTAPLQRKMGLTSSAFATPNTYVSGVRETTTAGLLTFANGLGGDTWSDLLGLDVANSALVLGDPAAASSPRVTKASAMPTSGTWGAGSFVYNTAPAISSGKILLGWTRLTTGSAHVAGTDWSPAYVTTS